MRQSVYLTDYDSRADSGQVTVQYRNLFPDAVVKPTDADPNGEGVSYETLRILVVRGHKFLPVEPGMWLGLRVQWGNEGSILVPVALSRTDDDYAVNLWRTKPGGSGDLDGDIAGVNNIDERLAWEINRSGIVIAHRVDRQARDGGGNGFFDPFVVKDADGLPVLASKSFFSGADTLTVYRRSRRMGSGTHARGDGSDPITWGSGTYAENAEVAGTVTLMWRDTAERILRVTDAVPAGPIEWSWYRNN